MHRTPPRARPQALRDTAGTPPLTACLAAVQIVAVQWALANDNAKRLTRGETVEGRLPGALRDAEHAFALLEGGLGDLLFPLGG